MIIRKIYFLTFILILLFLTVGCSDKNSIENNQEVFNVFDFGAKGDSLQLATGFIQATINACAKAGGGKVVFSSGTYRTGTIFLKNNVTLFISKDAIILGSTDLEDYPRLSPNYEFYGREWRDQSLIYGEKLHNITIEGTGTIDGQGGSFVITNNKKPFRYMNRPYGLWFVQCKNIRVENVHLRNSAFWMQHYLACDQVEIKGISVFNHSNKNNDMIDIDGCHDVVITNCIGDSDDDGITLKSTSPRLNKNVRISNCTVSSHCNAIKLGTESSGGFKNISITDCIIKPSAKTSTIYGKPAGDGGIALEVVDGGTMDSIYISNIQIDGPEVPLFIRLGNRARKYKKDLDTPAIGQLKNITISDITATGANPIGVSITGLPGHRVEQITLNNIKISYSGGGTKEDASKTVEELADHYPEGNMFGHLPSYGLFIRHAEQIKLSNIELSFEHNDDRPAMICNDIDGLIVKGLKMDAAKHIESCVVLENVKNVLIKGEVCGFD